MGSSSEHSSNDGDSHAADNVSDKDDRDSDEDDEISKKVKALRQKEEAKQKLKDAAKKKSQALKTTRDAERKAERDAAAKSRSVGQLCNKVFGKIVAPMRTLGPGSKTCCRRRNSCVRDFEGAGTACRCSCRWQGV